VVAQSATIHTRFTIEAFAYVTSEKDSKFHVVEVLRRRFRDSDVIANGNGRSTTSIPVITFIVTTSSRQFFLKFSRDDISENWRSSCACPLGAEA
jgi:hypothetical protein